MILNILNGIIEIPQKTTATNDYSAPISILVWSGVILIVVLTFALSVWLFWTALFVPYVKKLKIDDKIKLQNEELEKIRIKTQEEIAGIKGLYEEKDKLEKELLEITDKLRKITDEKKTEKDKKTSKKNSEKTVEKIEEI